MNKLLFRMLTIGLVLIFTACSDDDTTDPVSSGDTLIDTPATYTFESRYVAGESSVSYSGQVVRNMLISAIKSHITDETVTAAKLTSLYNNDDATAVYTDGTTLFHDISTSRLENKISPETVLGYNVTPAALMSTWFDAAESLAGANVTGGVFVNQMVGKGLLGTVSYYQGTSVYLGDSKLDGDTNTQDCEDDGTCNNYSDMEHHWDESFGYFGAARTYSTMTDEQRQSSGSGDYKEDVNFDWAKYASKRSGIAGDFDDLIMNAYLEGRTLITNQASLSEIKDHRDIIVMNWEKVVAANVVHYANDVIGLIEAGGTDFDCSADSNCGKYWSEMAAFVLSLQYNAHSDMTDSELTALHNLVGQAPPVAGEGTDYITSLNTVNSTIGEKLGWTADQLAAF